MIEVPQTLNKVFFFHEIKKNYAKKSEILISVSC